MESWHLGHWVTQRSRVHAVSVGYLWAICGACSSRIFVSFRFRPQLNDVCPQVVGGNSQAYPSSSTQATPLRVILRARHGARRGGKISTIWWSLD